MDNQLKQELSNIEIPTELHQRSKKGVSQAKTEMGGKVKGFMRKRLLPAVVAASIMIPTGAFAYQALLADDLYESFDNLKKHVASATMEGYLLFDAKLTQAKGDLGKEQFKQFKALLNVFTTAKLEYGDKNGNIDYSVIPAQQVEEIKEALYEIQPYFDRLNGEISSKEVLTSEEYEEYIQALMTNETIMSKSGILYANGIEEIPTELQDEYTEVKNVFMHVYEKQAQYYRGN
ncbi:DUF3600 domain-containing protein [Lysinibacillus sp. NPDC096418]|uniref:DUF3600 domain-containing protein n=1 Tax=Lysinibacillus sp. NPDC096418 TaxID=3364138 RepID=UPI0037FDAC61